MLILTAAEEESLLRCYSVSLSVSVCQNMSQSRAATSIRTTAEGWRVLVRDPVMQDSTTEAVYKRITESGFGGVGHSDSAAVSLWSTCFGNNESSP